MLVFQVFMEACQSVQVDEDLNERRDPTATWGIRGSVCQIWIPRKVKKHFRRKGQSQNFIISLKVVTFFLLALSVLPVVSANSVRYPDTMAWIFQYFGTIFRSTARTIPIYLLGVRQLSLPETTLVPLYLDGRFQFHGAVDQVGYLDVRK